MRCAIDSGKQKYYRGLMVLHCLSNSMNKKDGYRQQNVRQRQKLISIIDYDVYMTFY